MTAPPEFSDSELDRLLRRSTLMEDAREPAIERAIGVWKPRPRRAPGVLQRVLAVLKFDSAAAGALPQGVRASGPRTRQILFVAAGRDVDVRITQIGDDETCRYEVCGQIFGTDTKGSVQLRTGSYLAIQTWSELAEFRFPDVPAGRFTLTLLAEDMEVELPAIDAADLG